MNTKNYNAQSQKAGGANLPLTLTIEGREFQWTKQYITGKEARQLAGLPTDADLYLSLTDPWDDEPIGLDAQVNLAREGVESFYIRNPLPFVVEGKQHRWKGQFINKDQLKKLIGLSAHDQIFLQMQKPYADEEIGDKAIVDLARPGIEQFRVIRKEADIRVSIKINDKPFPVKHGSHLVAELKRLAGVPLTDELSQLLKGKLVPLADEGAVIIKGGEEFFSCKKEGASS